MRALEAELGQYTDEDDFPKNNEDFIRPGGLVRLNETDETPRYLGPSSGIAMTRLLMEEAKRYTESTRISELIPEVRGRRRPGLNDFDPASSSETRSQSFSVLPPTAASRRKSYPMISAVPAQNLPSRAISDKLVEVFCQRGELQSLHSFVASTKPLTLRYRPNIHPNCARENASGHFPRCLRREPRTVPELLGAFDHGYQPAETGRHICRFSR